MSFPVSFAGRSRYLTDVEQDAHFLLVAVPCRVENGPPTLALLDTASEWCLLAWPLAEECGCVGGTGELPIRLHTRFGLIVGWLERLTLRLLAAEGEPIELEGTWFVSPDWDGPTVLGWRAGLERFRFTLDPAEDWFYFGEGSGTLVE